MTCSWCCCVWLTAVRRCGRGLCKVFLDSRGSVVEVRPSKERLLVVQQHLASILGPPAVPSVATATAESCPQQEPQAGDAETACTERR